MAAIVIVAGIIYIPRHAGKYPRTINIVDNNSDFQKVPRSVTALSVRFLSDDEIISLQQFGQLDYLDFSTGWRISEAKLTNMGLKTLSELNLPKLEWLMLGYCNKITDDGMWHIANIRNLKYLSLYACSQITDNGLSNLASSSGISTVDLRGCTGITDRGVGYLKKIPGLKHVDLGGCVNVTAAAITDLRKGLPGCNVTKDDHEWATHTRPAAGNYKPEAHGQAHENHETASAGPAATVKLLSPESGAVFPNGNYTKSMKYVWEFRWSEVPQAQYYHLHVIGARATIPLINRLDLTSPGYRGEMTGYIADPNRFGWRWRVRAMVNGVWGDYSEERTFDVEPLRAN